MTKSKQVVYQDNEYVIFEDGSGGAIMSNEEIEDAEKFDEWFNSLTKEEQGKFDYIKGDSEGFFNHFQ